MKHLALWAIRLYQRHTSPRKGFSCAYRRATGRLSCSAFGYRAIERHGLWLGLRLLRRRLKKCRAAYEARTLQNTKPTRQVRSAQMQAGFCDIDLPLGDCDACDATECCDLPCDWSSRRKKQK